MFWKYHENDLFKKRFAFGKVLKKVGIYFCDKNYLFNN
jgi:hypothetical protein